jgi:Ran GTPase-activating protein (RanGAP) involved in mRNA processing and transport
VLDLKDAELTDRDAELLAQAIQQGARALIELDLAHNNISDDGAVLISKALAAHKTIARVDLSENDIGETGAHALLESVQSNHSVLMDIKLQGNPNVSQQAIRAINQACTKNRVLRNLKKYLGREAMEIEKETVWREVSASFNGTF